ncbi:MAG: hypothetical protein IKO61_01765 [Lachnospiraceae bacterium]|nr:hypothetical protein [Lachnospiraceae bacterium]
MSNPFDSSASTGLLSANKEKKKTIDKQAHIEEKKQEFDFEDPFSGTTVTLESKSTATIKPVDLNKDTAKVGKKSWKPWQNLFTPAKVEIPAKPPIVPVEVKNTTLEEVKEKENEHAEAKKTLSELDDDFEVIDFGHEEKKEKKEEEKKDEVVVETTETIEKPVEEPAELSETQVRTILVEIRDELKKAEFGMDIESKQMELAAKISEISQAMDKVRSDKSASAADVKAVEKLQKKLDSLLGLYSEANDVLHRLEHRQTAISTVKKYGNLIEKNKKGETAKMTREDSETSISDGYVRGLKRAFREAADTLESKNGALVILKPLIADLRAYGELEPYSKNCDKKEAVILKKLVVDIRKVENDRHTDTSRIVGLREASLMVKNLMRGGLDLLSIDQSKIDHQFREPDERMDKASFSTKVRQNVLFSSLFSEMVDVHSEPLFTHEPSINDLRQGKVSNCYMVSAITSLINYDPRIIKNAMHDTGNGRVVVRYYVDGHERYISVEKRIPKLKTGGNILTDGPLWISILERAMAYIGRRGNKGYGSLWYGDGSEVIQLFTGAKAESRVAIKSSATNERSSSDRQFDEDEKTTIFTEICAAGELGRVYSCGTYNSSGSGLNDGHAYTLLGGKEINGVRYVRLRNPYANMSLRYHELGIRTKSTTFLSSSHDSTHGQFYMKFDEFLRDFASISYMKISDAPGV